MKRTELAVDCILQSLRVRLGWCIAHIEKAPRFASVIATMDTKAARWARAAVGQPNIAAVTDVMAGELAPLNFDLTSTRHLVSRD
jgi:hypothetical protein